MEECRLRKAITIIILKKVPTINRPNPEWEDKNLMCTQMPHDDTRSSSHYDSFFCTL